MENFERYFLHEKKILLENISYETVPVEGRPTDMKLGVKDTIVAQLLKNGVKINFNRALNFDPEGIFSLSAIKKDIQSDVLFCCGKDITGFERAIACRRGGVSPPANDMAFTANRYVCSGTMKGIVPYE